MAVAAGVETEMVMDEEDERGAVFWRLEKIGYRVGQGLVERYVSCVACACVLIEGRSFAFSFFLTPVCPLRDVISWCWDRSTATTAGSKSVM